MSLIISSLFFYVSTGNSIQQYLFAVVLYLFVVKSLSHVQLFTTPWTAARQAAMSITISQNLFRLRSIESVVPSNYLILCCPLLLLLSISSIRVLPLSQLLASGGQSTGTSASASVLPVNIQGSFPLGLTGLTSLLSKGFSRIFSSTTIQKHQFFGAQPSLWSDSYIHTRLLEKP